jgi:hypothetical protein
VELTVTVDPVPKQTEVAVGEVKSVISGGVFTTSGAEVPTVLPAHPGAVAVSV